MKITIYQLISTLNIEKELLPQKLPIRTAYNLSKIFARAREELEFYQEKFKEIITQYGEKDENGNLIFLENENVSIQKDKVEECKKEITDRERHTQSCSVQDQPAGKRQTRRHCRCSDENETTVVIHQIQRKQHPFGCGKHEGWPRYHKFWK